MSGDASVAWKILGDRRKIHGIWVTREVMFAIDGGYIPSDSLPQGHCLQLLMSARLLGGDVADRLYCQMYAQLPVGCKSWLPEPNR